MATDALDKQAAAEITQGEYTRMGRRYRPNVDIIERADELTLVADMPGTAGDSIDINFENGTLTIHGKVEDREQSTYILREYGVGDFWRTFQVSEQIDASRIEASFTDGVLTLHLPKIEAAKPRKITVRGQ